MALSVKLQYFDGCPNWKAAEREIIEAAARTGLDIDLAYELIESHEQAQAASFRGSPTVLIEDRDPFAEPGAPIGLSCRVYRRGVAASGSPGLEELEQALRSASR